jgi:hypothetical protein
MIVAQGDISVAAGVTNGNNPAIEGVYFTDRRFLTGTVGAGNDDTRLVVRGAVYAQEAQLERDLREGNTNTPAEDFRFAKEVLLNYPQSLSPKRLIWRETLP